VVPETYRKLCRMFIRWDRSCTNLRFPVAYLSISLWLINAIRAPSALGRMLLAIMVVSKLYVLYYLRSERSWNFAYGILYGYFSFFALSWIFTYAALTLRSRGWLTR